MIFKKGDKVYHRRRKQYGIFQEYDKHDTATATVLFSGDYNGYISDDYCEITHSLLVPADDVMEDSK
jgi:hypothetical protein